MWINYVRTVKMNRLIEERLSRYKSQIIDYAGLKSILVNLEFSNINDKIKKLRDDQVLKPLKKGIYIFNSTTSDNVISKELISNILLGNPSYISLDYALSYYGLIPEAVHEITAVTTKRSKLYETDYGIFSYKHIKNELFDLGLNLKSTPKGNFLIALKEKALCDKIFLTRDIQLTSKQMMLEFLLDDLRIDTEIFNALNIKIVSTYYEISKSKKIQIFLNLMNSK
jgi:predicted transcriptional regulator of viral defense system